MGEGKQNPRLVHSTTPPRAEPAPDPLGALTARAADGDRRALEMLIRALGPRTLGIARRILGPANAEVEDAAQESLVAVAHALESFRGDSSVIHWATRIAVRTCLHVREGTHRRERRKGALAASQPPAPPRPDAAVAAWRRELIRDLLSELPPEQAETLTMRVVLGMSLKETADATGVPVNTVRSRVRLAKEALRRRLEQRPHGRARGAGS